MWSTSNKLYSRLLFKFFFFLYFLLLSVSLLIFCRAASFFGNAVVTTSLLTIQIGTIIIMNHCWRSLLISLISLNVKDLNIRWHLVSKNKIYAISIQSYRYEHFYRFIFFFFSFFCKKQCLFLSASS